MSIIKKDYGDVEVTIKKIEHEESPVQTAENSNVGLTSIAFAKRADNEKGAQYYANFVEEDNMKFAIAITRSV